MPRAKDAAAAPPPPPPDPVLATALKAIMRRHWGHSEFRPLQAEAVAATLTGRDALVILPTGAGLTRGGWLVGAGGLPCRMLADPPPGLPPPLPQAAASR